MSTSTLWFTVRFASFQKYNVILLKTSCSLTFGEDMLVLGVLVVLLFVQVSPNNDMDQVVRAVYTDRAGAALQTVWGHDASAGGAARVPKDAFSRLDLLQELRDHSPSAACRSALDNVLEARAQLKLWAVKMHSSSVILPDALITGSLFELGDYDACLSVPEAMYCLVDVEVHPDPSSAAAYVEPHKMDERSPFEPPHGDNATTWDLLQTSGNQRRYRRDQQHWAVCVPAACGTAAGEVDVHLLGGALADVFSPMAGQMGVELRLHVDPKDCARHGAEGAERPRTLRQRIKDPIFLILSAIILSFPLLSVTATIRDCMKNYSNEGCGLGFDPEKKEGWISSLLNCFAIQRSWKVLLRKDESEVSAIQGIRTISMCGIILGHRFFSLLAGPLRNPEFLEDAFTKLLGTYLVNGSIVVTTFLVISGFLNSRSLMTIMSKLGKKFNVVVVLHINMLRYLRLAPALAVMLCVEALWVPLMGSGPLWQRGAGRLSHGCSTAWWTHLLFINNYINVDGALCLVQTWYLAVDFQLHLATPLVMWLVYKMTRRSPRPGLLLLFFLLVVFSIVVYATALILNLDAMTHVFPQILRNWGTLHYPTFGLMYVPTHTNAVPYILGLMSGTLLFLSKHHKWQVPKWLQRTLCFGIPVGHLLQTATFFSCVLLFTPAFEQIDPRLSLLYSPARLLAFSIPTAWIIYACGMGYGDIFGRLMGWTPFVILGRLTYSVFLVHMTVVTVTAGVIRVPQYLTASSFLLQILSDISASYLLGFVFFLTVEAPLAKLQKRLRTFTTERNYKDTNISPQDDGVQVQLTKSVFEDSKNNHTVSLPSS